MRLIFIQESLINMWHFLHLRVTQTPTKIGCRPSSNFLIIACYGLCIIFESLYYALHQLFMKVCLLIVVLILPADGHDVLCSSSGMQITFDKSEFFYLPEHMTLTDTRCTSESNDTHIRLSTDYQSCLTSTTVSVSGSGASNEFL